MKYQKNFYSSSTSNQENNQPPKALLNIRPLIVYNIRFLTPQENNLNNHILTTDTIISIHTDIIYTHTHNLNLFLSYAFSSFLSFRCTFYYFLIRTFFNMPLFWTNYAFRSQKRIFGAQQNFEDFPTTILGPHWAVDFRRSLITQNGSNFWGLNWTQKVKSAYRNTGE